MIAVATIMVAIGTGDDATEFPPGTTLPQVDITVAEVDITVADPGGIASNTEMLVVGTDPEKMMELDFAGRSFPLRTSIVFDTVGNHALRVEARLASGKVLAEGAVIIELTNSTATPASTVISLKRPCGSKEECNAIVRREKEAGKENLMKIISEAESVTGDKAKCDTPKAVADVWARLKTITVEDHLDAQAKRATRKLERCRGQIELAFRAGLRKVMQGQREAMAKRIEVGFLDEGFDIQVKISGAKKNRITLTWALMGRVAVHKMTDGGSLREGSFLHGLQKVGFRRATFTAGHQGRKHYDLKPEDESSVAVLESMGLDKPLRWPDQ